MIKLRGHKRKALLIFISLAGVISILHFSRHSPPSQAIETVQKGILFTKATINKALRGAPVTGKFPTEVVMEVQEGEKIPVKLQYSFDARLQKAITEIFQTYSPDYGAFVAMDASTGRVLAIVSYAKEKDIEENLALRATFPSASVFKVVTAAAAIESHKMSGNTMMSFHGRQHTLYRHQIFKPQSHHARFITIKEAFSHSNNTIFGKLGVFTIGAEGLKQYADRFGFNRQISSDLPMQEGKAWIPNDPNDQWGLAEAASGFTLTNTMSPLQGALIAATIANDGVMMEPFAVESIATSRGENLYAAVPKIANVVIDPETAREIKVLMRETVLHGTSRGSFRGFFRKNGQKNEMVINVGGKTGTLTGMDPKGKTDWFVGFADSGTKRIAIAALTVHEKLWRVKSSYLARRAIETYFKP